MIRKALGTVLFTLAFVSSAVYVFHESFMIGETQLGEGKKVIRFAHWQLEGRTVEALDWAAAEYMKLHPDVYVQQIPIPERGYKQWVRTQLIGRTAPDLIESYFSPNLTVRYFAPITDVVEKPNPYNKGTPLEGVPWRETYVDGMKGGRDSSLQDYYKMPLSVFTVRIYANKDLLDEAARTAGAPPVTEPKTLGELFRLCDLLREYGARTGKRIVPIAGSDNTAKIFRGRYWVMATWGLLDLLDTDLDGQVTAIERYEALMSRRLNVGTDPHIRAAYQVLFELSRHFNPGFMAAKRDLSVLLFAQGNAAMVASGSWDASTLHRQVGGDFEIAVFDFPVASADDPKYGKYVRNRATEAGERAGFPFALSRHSKHPQIAIDFMQFLSSRMEVEVDGKRVPMNEELNHRFRWFPATIGSEADEMLKPFAPKVEGVYRVYWEEFGTRTSLLLEQAQMAYISEEEPIEDEYEDFLAFYRKDPGAFKKTHGRLAGAFIARGIAPESYSYAQFIEDWREEHYRQFIHGYAENLEKLAPADYLSVWEKGYNSIVQLEGSLAAARTRAIRLGLTTEPTEEVKRNLTALIFGQAGRIVSRAEEKQRYEKATAGFEAAKGGAE